MYYDFTVRTKSAKRSTHGSSTQRAYTGGENGWGSVARYSPRVLSFVGVAIEGPCIMISLSEPNRTVGWYL